MSPGEPRLGPEQFVAKWRNVDFGEKQASQEMFLDICALVGHPTPVEYGHSEVFTFEKWVPGGFADAFREGHFGWEFKGSPLLHGWSFKFLVKPWTKRTFRFEPHSKSP